MTPDAIVLVAASRSDHEHHAAALDWLEAALRSASQGMPLRLQPMVVARFLRLVTHPRIFLNPTPMAAALAFVDALLAAPCVEQPSLGPEWPTFRKLCEDRKLAANAIPDAWLAAAVIHQSEHLVSFDGDFRRLLPRTQFTRLLT